MSLGVSLYLSVGNNPFWISNSIQITCNSWYKSGSIQTWTAVNSSCLIDVTSKSHLCGYCHGWLYRECMPSSLLLLDAFRVKTFRDIHPWVFMFSLAWGADPLGIHGLLQQRQIIIEYWDLAGWYIKMFQTCFISNPKPYIHGGTQHQSWRVATTGCNFLFRILTS